jgi:hypothetical protein
MCFLLEGCHDFVKTFDVGRANATANCAFQNGQMVPKALRESSSFRRRSHHKCAPICFADCPGDQSTFCEAIEDTG